MNNPQILHSQEVHPLHVARDMSLASTNIEVAVDLILERCEATATIEMPERIAHGSFAFIRKIERQQVIRADHPDAMNPRTFGDLVAAMHPAARAGLRQGRLSTGQSKSGKRDHSAAAALQM